MSTTKFSVFPSVKAFDNRYPEVEEGDIDAGASEFANNQYGEVSLPGLGWFAALIGRATNEPILFYTEDDGWQPVPVTTFVKVNRGGAKG